MDTQTPETVGGTGVMVVPIPRSGKRIRKSMATEKSNCLTLRSKAPDPE